MIVHRSVLASGNAGGCRTPERSRALLRTGFDTVSLAAVGFDLSRVGAGLRRGSTPGGVALQKQAEKTYRTECATWGVTTESGELLAEAAAVSAASQCTVLESHLCRALKKVDKASRVESVQKYLGLFANVSPSTVVPQLWSAAQKVLQEGTASKPSASKK